MAIRRAIAALIDAALAALLGYIGFRLAVPLSGCTELSSCPQLTPLILVAAIAIIGLYFFTAYVAWHQTIGQIILRIPSADREVDDL